MEYLPKGYIDYKRFPNIIHDYSYLQKMKEETNKDKSASKHRLLEQNM